jgi:hypothetical protein
MPVRGEHEFDATRPMHRYGRLILAGLLILIGQSIETLVVADVACIGWSESVLLNFGQLKP